jgi:hypothetical protein
MEKTNLRLLTWDKSKPRVDQICVLHILQITVFARSRGELMVINLAVCSLDLPKLAVDLEGQL